MARLDSRGLLARLCSEMMHGSITGRSMHRTALPEVQPPKEVFNRLSKELKKPYLTLFDTASQLSQKAEAENVTIFAAGLGSPFHGSCEPFLSSPGRLRLAQALAFLGMLARKSGGFASFHNQPTAFPEAMQGIMHSIATQYLLVNEAPARPTKRSPKDQGGSVSSSWRSTREFLLRSPAKSGLDKPFRHGPRTAIRYLEVCERRMHMLKKYFALLSITILLGVAPLLADQWNKKTVVKFTAPVQLPGMTLPAGTYVFKLADSLSNRHIVQVFNEDETVVLNTILAIPNYRLEPAEETVLKFEERPGNHPDAIRAWFYPGDNFGQEFVYPKVQGAEIAAKDHVPVLITEAPAEAKPEQLIEAPVTVAQPEKTLETAEVPMTTEPPKLERPAPEPVPPVIPVRPAEELPETASGMPLVALLGASSLFIAVVLRRLAKGC